MVHTSAGTSRGGWGSTSLPFSANDQKYLFVVPSLYHEGGFPRRETLKIF